MFDGAPPRVFRSVCRGGSSELANRSRNPIGWLMLALAVATGSADLGQNAARPALLSAASASGWPRWPARVGGWITGLALGSLILIFLLFPNGRRWARLPTLHQPLNYLTPCEFADRGEVLDERTPGLTRGGPMRRGGCHLGHPRP